MKKIGLVLVGGGGRGAYHIGVWKAFRKAGLEQYVSAVSGTSVGGLNAALFVQGDFEKAQYVWEHISKEDILAPRTVHGGKRDDGFSLFSNSGLERIIEDNLDLDVFERSRTECYMTGRRVYIGKDMENYEERFTCPDGRKRCRTYVNGNATYFNMRGFSNEDRKSILLATSAMPFILPPKEVDGYGCVVDGGTADNVPVEPLYRVEKCKMIIIVHLTTNDGNRDYRKKFPDAGIHQIRPEKEQGGLFSGILDFTAEGAKSRIQQGYDDTIGMFQNIVNNINEEISHTGESKMKLEEEQWFSKMIELIDQEIWKKLNK